MYPILCQEKKTYVTGNAPCFASKPFPDGLARYPHPGFRKSSREFVAIHSKHSESAFKFFMRCNRFAFHIYKVYPRIESTSRLYFPALYCTRENAHNNNFLFCYKTPSLRPLSLRVNFSQNKNLLLYDFSRV